MANPNTNSSSTAESGCIAGGLPLKVMRIAMENKGLLDKAGALYSQQRGRGVICEELPEILLFHISATRCGCCAHPGSTPAEHPQQKTLQRFPTSFLYCMNITSSLPQNGHGFSSFPLPSSGLNI